MAKNLACLMSIILLIVFPEIARSQFSPENEIENFKSFTPDEQVDTLAAFCWQNREKNTDIAIRAGEYGIELARKYDFKSSLSKLNNFLGVIFQHYKGETSHAIGYYNDALNYALQTNDSVEIAYVYNNLGDAFYLIGNVPLAQEYAEKSMDIFQKIGDKRGVAYSFINMGLLNRINQNYDSSLYYLNKAIELRKSFDDSVGIASATLEVGRTLLKKEEFSDALEYFQKSLKMHQKLDNKNYMAYSLQGIGDVYFHENKIDSAFSVYKRALILNTERGNISGIISNQLGIAMVYAKRGRVRAGEELLNDALQQAKKTGITQNVLNVYKTMGRFYYELEAYKNASENYQNYITVYDSIFSELQFQTLNEIKNRFQIAERLNETNKNLADKQRELFYLLSVIFLLLIIAAVLILRYRTKVKMSKKLETSNQSKDKMFSIISHDLLSPFNALIGFSDILLENLQNKEYDEARENAKIIYKSSDDTYRMTTNLLNWARAQQHRIKFNPETFNILKLIKDVASMSAMIAEYKKIKIEVPEYELINVKADKNLIRTVLSNLLNNAIKFTAENGAVKIWVESKENEILVAVEDDGIGISEKNLPKLFHENELISTPGTQNEKGTGLGLLVCKEFIEICNGKIWAESKEGKGATFFFTLPG